MEVPVSASIALAAPAGAITAIAADTESVKNLLSIIKISHSSLSDYNGILMCFVPLEKLCESLCQRLCLWK